jgi:calcium-dependent protein kinase
MAQLETLLVEISILKDLDHPNIINCYDVYEDAKLIYMVMDY